MIDEVLKFLSQNKEIIMICISLISGVLTIIFSFLGEKFLRFKKIASVIGMLPGFINEAESLPVPGYSKYQFVINKVFEQFELIGINKSVAAKKYIALIDSAIEQILSTPQKKECRK